MKCERPGCDGTIDETGYCDECGRAPRRQSPAPSPVTPASAAPAPDPPRITAATTAIRPSKATARTTTATRRSAGGRLVELPAVERRDPLEAVLTDPNVPEDRRYCSVDGKPVGRSRDGTPGRVEGFCPSCGHPFSFAPKLRPGQLVGNQYEVAGCLAHGGLGWIYLARDRKVADQWVALKGLINTDDADAMEAAIAERRFLAEVKHPNIVQIYNFVEHDAEGYIVMEYVDGDSLKSKRRGGPLPVAEAIEYLLPILPALGHLHSLGLLYCDFKPDNVMVTPHGMKLIDLGAVYRAGSGGGAIYGTVGYQAAEIATTGPTVPSDLYTVARTLAVLCTDFRGYQSTYRSELPSRDEVPQFAEHPALYRFLQRATAANPDERFQSADEMADQLLGVGRQVVAADGVARPGPSTLFAGERPSTGSSPPLPLLLVSPDDPAVAALASLDVDDDQLVAALRALPVQSNEVRLRLARTLLEQGDDDAATLELDALAADDEWEWRVGWYRGLLALAADKPGEALDQFDAVDRELPGELAPKLGVAVAAEAAGSLDRAASHYDVVSRTDPSFTSAAFGLARCRLAYGDDDGARTALARVPEGSSAHVDAQHAWIETITTSDHATPKQLVAAKAALDKLQLDEPRRAPIQATILQGVLARLQDAPDPDPDLASFGPERQVRFDLESSYRAQARYAPSMRARAALVDEANRVRPRTWT
jgi:serine/threonine-protein kinase PknG